MATDQSFGNMLGAMPAQGVKAPKSKGSKLGSAWEALGKMADAAKAPSHQGQGGGGSHDDKVQYFGSPKMGKTGPNMDKFKG